jgi:hypothetical protein
MLEQRFSFQPIDYCLWALQVVLILLALRNSPRSTFRRMTSLGAPHCVIAILLAWLLRLAYYFVLTSTGFHYLVPDDVARWLLAWGWAASPYFITWDGIWQGGTFYLHGMAMRLFDDPLIASKIVSCVVAAMTPVGLFILAQGLYRDVLISIATVLVGAPWWFHILLGTGAMTEMPVTGLVLAGVGLLCRWRDPATDPRSATRSLFLAAVCFMLATTFHVIAWMLLAGFVGVAMVSAEEAPQRQEWKRLLGAGAIAVAYCGLWIIGCWIKFGSPLGFMEAYSANTDKHLGVLDVSVRALAYPRAFLFDTWWLLPLIVLTGVRAWALRDTKARSERFVLLGVLATLAIMTASAIIGNPSNKMPVRACITLAALLLPSAVFGVVSGWQRCGVGSRIVVRTAYRVATLTLVAVWCVGNHRQVFLETRSQGSMDPDALALGTWLRETLVQPGADGKSKGGRTIHLWLDGSALYPDYSIQYGLGAPRWVIRHDGRESQEAVVGGAGGGEWIVTDKSVAEQQVQRVVQIGRYSVWERRREK